MLQVSRAKDDLARQLLPNYIEDLYIKLINELIKYLKIVNTDDENAKQIILNNTKKILKEILDSKSINDLDKISIVFTRNYPNPEINLINSYVTLRKSIYSYMEYFLYLLIKKESINELEKALFIISINALKMFDIDEILESKASYIDYYKLLNICNDYLNKKSINSKDLESIDKNILNKYQIIIDTINDSYMYSLKLK